MMAKKKQVFSGKMKLAISIPVFGAALLFYLGCSSQLDHPIKKNGDTKGSEAMGLADTAAIAPSPLADDAAAEALSTTIDKKMKDSDLVFVGSVTDVKFGFSSALKKAKIKLPLTYVTFKVEEVINGVYSKSEIVVRHVGGWREDGRFMAASIQPIFAKGDRDILFLKNNTIYAHPILLDGRFPIIDGKVYNSDSMEVQVDAAKNLKLGKLHAMQSILERPLGKNGFKLTVNSSSMPTSETSTKGDGPSQTTMMSQPSLLLAESASAGSEHATESGFKELLKGMKQNQTTQSVSRSVSAQAEPASAVYGESVNLDYFENHSAPGQ